MEVKVLGTGCKNCDTLYANAVAAATEINGSCPIEVKKVADIAYFAKMGVFLTPALVVAGKVISMGKVLSVEQIREKIKEFI